MGKRKPTTEEILENLKERWLDMKLTTAEYKKLVREVKADAEKSQEVKP